jgi:hypothetical protein
VSGAVDWEPVSALAPDQPPDAVQLVAFVELHVSVEEPPLAIVAGTAASETVGGGGGVPAVTVTLCDAVPPAPLQLNVNVVVADKGTVGSVPLVILLPLQPPEAVQLVALVEFQVSVVTFPTTTEAGFAVRVTDGAAGPAATVTVAVWLALPPAPEQLNVNDVSPVRPETSSAPLALRLPLHPPDAVQPVASVEFQVTVVLPPLATDDGLTEIATVGADEDTVTATVFWVVPPAPPQVSV